MTTPICAGKGLLAGGGLLFLALAGCGAGGTSVKPVAGGGSHEVFQATFVDPQGAAHIQSASVLINGFLEGSKACYIYYFRDRKAFLLVNDAGTTSTPLAVGATGSVSNSQCKLDGQGSSVADSDKQLTLRLDLTFQPAFHGEKQIFLASEDTGGRVSALASHGSWTVP